MNTELNTNPDLKKEIRRDAGINAILLIGFWIIYFSASLILPNAIGLFVRDKYSDLFENIFVLAFYIILYPVGFSLLFILFRKISKKYKDQRLMECFKKPQTPPGWTVKWIFLSIGATYAAAYISSILFAILELITGVKLQEAEFSYDNSALGTFTTIISVPIFAPIFEELFFRATIYRNVRNYGTWSMIIICGITFGLWHANYSQFLFASVMGIFSCFLYEKTKSVIPSMIVHFIINSIGAATMLLIGQLGIDSKNEITANPEMLMSNPLVMIIMMLIGFFMIAFLITWLILMIAEIIEHKESFILEPKNKEISGGKKLITYLSSPLMAATMIAMLALTVYRALGGKF